MASRPLRGILKSTEDGAKLARKGPNKVLSWGESVPNVDVPPGPLAAERELWEDMECCWREDGSSPLSGRRGGALRTGGAVLESDWDWFDPDVRGLLDGRYPCVLEKLLELTEFEFTVSIPLSKRQREVEVNLLERRKEARLALAEGREPEYPSVELRCTVSDLLEVDAGVQELHRVAVLELEHLQKRLGCGKFAS